MTQLTPTQTIKNWINDFVTKPNPVFGNLPPCPFARKAIVDNRVVFQEMSGITDYATLYQSIFNFDFDTHDVLCMILPVDHFTPKETTQIAKDLNLIDAERHSDIGRSSGHYRKCQTCFAQQWRIHSVPGTKFEQVESFQQNTRVRTLL